MIERLNLVFELLDQPILHRRFHHGSMVMVPQCYPSAADAATAYDAPAPLLSRRKAAVELCAGARALANRAGGAPAPRNFRTGGRDASANGVAPREKRSMKRITSRHNALVARFRAVARGDEPGLLLDGPHLVAGALRSRAAISH